MSTVTLDTEKMEAFRETLSIDDENMLTDTIAYIRETKKSPTHTGTPPGGYMTGDEFERRVKERVTNFYKENGLL